MILIDDFPFDLYDVDLGEADIILLSKPAWMGPSSPEIEEARREGLRRSWENNPDRHKQAAEQLRLARPTMPPSHAVLSSQHKENIAKGMRGNQNKTGKRGGNQYTKRKEL